MRCNHWTNRQRCDQTATEWLVSDGKRVPGSFLCSKHAQDCITEYREKLGEIWTSEKLEVTA